MDGGHRDSDGDRHWRCDGLHLVKAEAVVGQLHQEEEIMVVQYDFKWRSELIFALWTAALTAGFQILTTVDPEQITDWKTWAIAALAAIARAVGAAGLNFMVRLADAIRGV